MVGNGVAFLFLILMHVRYTHSAYIEYDRNGTGLTEVPSDIPANVQIIRFSYNHLTFFESNAFSALPLLERIYSAFNKLSYVDSTAFARTKLSIVTLYDNLLTEFPDLDVIKYTLEVLKLGNNLIRIIPEKRIWNLLNLQELYLIGNPLVHLPEFHRLLPQLSVLALQSITFVCCYRMANLKEYADGIVTLRTYPCDQPEEFEGIPWADMQQATLMSILHCGECNF